MPDLLSESEAPTFRPHEEQGFVSLLLDFPELYSSISEFLTPETFTAPEAKVVMAALQQDFNSTGILPSRKLLADRLAKQLFSEDPWESILALVNRPSDPREVPFLRATLHEWTERQLFATMYTDEAQSAFIRGDYDYLRGIVEKADRLRAADKTGFWLFEQIDELFVDRAVEHLSTGFKGLDKVLNNGGPSRGEVIIWMGPTGVGKSILLCNNAFTSVRNGLNVLYVTFELSATLTALRILGAMTNRPLDSFTIHNLNDMKPEEIVEKRQNQENVKHKAMQFATKSNMVIYDLPPDECSVDNVYTIIDTLKKTRSWTPDVVVLDYLELMVSRRASREDNEYMGQKRVSTEVRGLAKKENVLVFTATQSNRSSVRSPDANIDLDKSAESYGKNMPVDYVVSINQTEDEYRPPDGGPSIVRLWVAKNRNGPKSVSVAANVWYDRMVMTEII